MRVKNSYTQTIIALMDQAHTLARHMHYPNAETLRDMSCRNAIRECDMALAELPDLKPADAQWFRDMKEECLLLLRGWGVAVEVSGRSEEGAT